MLSTDTRSSERSVGCDPTGSASPASTTLGDDLPVMRPGCGSMSVDPNLVDSLRARFAGGTLRSRRLELADLDDEMEVLFDRGVTDGLPVTPPTEQRVLRMLEGTSMHARRDRRRGRPRPRRGHRREGRDQRGDGRMPSGTPAVGDRSPASGVHRRVQHSWRAGDDDARWAGADLQRSRVPERSG